jgi:chromosome segregation ATPase
VRHPAAEGFSLEAPKQGVEKLRAAYLFAVNIPANGSEVLEIEESTPMQKHVDIRTAGGIAEIGVYLKTNSRLDPELKDKLEQVISMHRGMMDLNERITTFQKQMDVYRERIDEINQQLVSLRKVPQAGELSRHLAKKMEEISARLQKSTISVADLEGQLLTERIALEDRLAELTLERRKDAVAGR